MSNPEVEEFYESLKTFQDMIPMSIKEIMENSNIVEINNKTHTYSRIITKSEGIYEGVIDKESNQGDGVGRLSDSDGCVYEG